MSWSTSLGTDRSLIYTWHDMHDNFHIPVQVAVELRARDRWWTVFSTLLRKHVRWYTYGTHFAPHDINVRELSSWKSRLDQAREYGIYFSQVPNVGIRDGINKTRQVFAYCRFDGEKCKTGLEHLEIYRKERDEKHQVFKNKPYHWPESHFADAFRYLWVSIREIQTWPSVITVDRRSQYGF